MNIGLYQRMCQIGKACPKGLFWESVAIDNIRQCKGSLSVSFIDRKPIAAYESTTDEIVPPLARKLNL